MSVRFTPSPRRTVGVEVELALVSRETLELVNAASGLLAEVGHGHPSGEHPKVKHELFESTIEIITGICDTVGQARTDLAGTVAQLQPLLDVRGIAMVGSGVHPFSSYTGLRQSPGDRYARLVDKIQWPAHRLMIHGVHVHVGVSSGPRAIAIGNALMEYLPLFVAVSASSPYWLGEDTGLASVRTKIFEVMPTAGLPSYFPDWPAFAHFVDTMQATGAIGGIREIWWDIRPHPDFGTVELRMCDGIPTLREVAAVAALAQCLVEELDRCLTAGEQPGQPLGWVIRENKWRATRWGLDARFMDDRGRQTPARELVETLVRRLTPIAHDLGCADELADLTALVKVGASYERQRRVVERGGDLRDVVDTLRREFLDGEWEH